MLAHEYELARIGSTSVDTQRARMMSFHNVISMGERVGGERVHSHDEQGGRLEGGRSKKTMLPATYRGTWLLRTSQALWSLVTKAYAGFASSDNAKPW